jgi:hypothetical protein
MFWNDFTQFLWLKAKGLQRNLKLLSLWRGDIEIYNRFLEDYYELFVTIIYDSNLFFKI